MSCKNRKINVKFDPSGFYKVGNSKNDDGKSKSSKLLCYFNGFSAFIFFVLILVSVLNPCLDR